MIDHLQEERVILWKCQPDVSRFSGQVYCCTETFCEQESRANDFSWYGGNGSQHSASIE